MLKKENIFDLIKQNNLETIKKIYTEEMLYETNEDNLNFMEYAVINGKVDIVKFLEENKMSIPNAINGKDTLVALVEMGLKAVPMIKYLGREKLDINKIIDTQSIFEIALSQKNTEISVIEAVIDLGADINYSHGEYGEYPIIKFIENNDKSEYEKISILKLISSKNMEFKFKKIPFTNIIKRKNPYIYPLQREKYKLFVEIYRTLKLITPDEMKDVKKYLNPEDIDESIRKDLIDLGLKFQPELRFPAFFYNYEQLLAILESANIKELEDENFVTEILGNNKFYFDDKKNIIEKFISKGGDINVSVTVGRDKFNILGYVVCFYDGSGEKYKRLMVEWLLEIGAKIESVGCSALFSAIWFGYQDYIKLFLDNGADINFVEDNGNTIFTKLGSRTTQGYSVSKENRWEIMKFIFESTKTKEEKVALMRNPFLFKFENKEYWTNPLDYFIRLFFDVTFELEIIKYYKNIMNLNEVIKYKEFDFDVMDTIMCSNTCEKKIELILEMGTEIKTRDLDGIPYVTILDWENKINKELMKFLIENEKEPNKEFKLDDGYITLLEYMVRKKYSTIIIETLVDKLDKIIEIEKYGSILFYAVNRAYPLSLIEKIIKKQDDINSRFNYKYYSKDYHPGNFTILAYVLYGILFNQNLDFDNLAAEDDYYNDQDYYRNTDEEEDYKNGTEEKNSDVIKFKKYEYTVNVVKLLLKYGADINTKFSINLIERKYAIGAEKEEYSILEAAIQRDIVSGYLELTELILNSGVDLNLTTGEHRERVEIYLCQRCLVDDEKIIEIFELIKKLRGNDLKLNSRSGIAATPILAASQRARATLIKWLIDNGGDPHVSGGFDNSNGIARALSNWAEIEPSKRVETVRVFLDAGLDIEIRDPDGETPLMIAAKFGALDSLEYLIKRGANIHASTDLGLSSIHFAVSGAYDYQFTRTTKMNEANKVKIINLLVENGADINSVPEEGLSPLGYAIYYHYNQIYDCLIKLGADVNLIDNHGTTPLLKAFRFNNLAVRNNLLGNSEVDITISDTDGQNLPFYFIRSTKDSEENALELLKYIEKTSYKADNNNETPLFYAVEGKLNFTKALLGKNYEINLESFHGGTPLNIACGFYAENIEDYNFNIQKDIIEALIENGVDVNYKNKNGLSALDIANNLKCKPLEELLISYGAKSRPKIGFNY